MLPSHYRRLASAETVLPEQPAFTRGGGVIAPVLDFQGYTL